MAFDPNQPFEVVSQPQLVRGSTFGWQNGPGSDSQDNGQFAGGGSSLNNQEDYAALPPEAGVPFGYQFPITNPQTGQTVWVTHRDSGPAPYTGRGVDLAPSAMSKLKASTDDPLLVDTKRAVPLFDPSKPFDVVGNDQDTAKQMIEGMKQADQAMKLVTLPMNMPPAPEQSDQEKMLAGMSQADQAMKLATLPMSLPPPEPAGPEFNGTPNLTMLRQGKVMSANQMPTPDASLLYSLGIPQPFAQQEDVPGELGPPNVTALRQGRVEQLPTDKKVKEAFAAIGNLPVDAANFALSPAGLATGAILPQLAPWIQRTVAAGFTAQQAYQAAEAPTLQGKIEALLGAGLGTVGVVKGPKVIEALKSKEEPTATPNVETPNISPARATENLGPTETSGTLGQVDGPVAPNAVPETGPAPGPAPVGETPQETVKPDYLMPSGRLDEGKMRAAILDEEGKVRLGWPEEHHGDIRERVYGPGTEPKPDQTGWIIGNDKDTFVSLTDFQNAKGDPDLAFRTKYPEKFKPEVPQTTPEPAGGIPEPVSTKNAYTEQQRVERSIPEAVQVASRDFGTVWDDAQAELAKDPTAGQRLVEDLNVKPRALSDKENAVLLHRQIEVQNEHDAAIKAVNENPGNTDTQARLDTARDAVQDVYDATKAAGTETGRGLNARRMLVNNDFSLAKMEAETRAVVNKGEPLSIDQAANIKALHERIAAAETKVAGYEAQEQFRAELKRAKASRAAEYKPQEFLRQSYDAAKSRIASRRGRLYAGIDPTSLVDEAIVGAYHISRGVAEFTKWSKVMIDELGEKIEPFLKDLFAKAKALHAESAKRPRGTLDDELRLAMAKKRTSEQIATLGHKIETGDLTKNVRKPLRPDRELLELRGQLEREKDVYRKMLEKGKRANMSWGQKAAEFFVRAERAMKLTGIHTLQKLAGAGSTRLITTPLEEAIGGILNKIPILRRIAEEAPREGGGSFRAEGKGLTTGFARGVRNIPRILKGERTNEAALFDKPEYYKDGGAIMDMPGRIHAAIKEPFKEVERERSTVLRQQHAIRKGLDPTDPATEHEIGQAAHIDAKRAIFMQDNILSNVFRGGVKILENSKKFPTAGFYLAKLSDFLLPIVKVPTNVALETATHLGGTVTATGKLTAVMTRGLKNIKPEEADMIMRHYKKGAVGAALFLTGYFNSDKFGGYYVKHEKRDSDAVRWGGARIAGVLIPAALLHAPAFLVLQAGATFRRVQDAKGSKSAALATAKGIADDIPFVREMSAIDSMLADGYEGNKQRGSLLSTTIVPQGVRDIATMLDDEDAQGNPVRRSPKSELDYLKMGIPYLREDVPLHDD